MSSQNKTDRDTQRLRSRTEVKVTGAESLNRNTIWHRWEEKHKLAVPSLHKLAVPSKFVQCFLDQHRPVRVQQQGEHANTCGLVVCHAKLIWLAGLNPGVKSNSALQSPEWGSTWGSQDDLPSYFYIQTGVKGWAGCFLLTLNYSIIVLFLCVLPSPWLSLNIIFCRIPNWSLC